jgi:hypothetical protein
MGVLAKQMTEWKEDLSFTVKGTWQKLSKNYAELIRTIIMLCIWARMINPPQLLRLFQKWAKGMDHSLEDKTSYTTQY